MARSTLDSRQVVIRTFLDQAVSAAHWASTADAKPANTAELDNVLTGIHGEIIPLLRLIENNPADLTVNVGASQLTNPETNRNRSIPHIKKSFVEFTGGSATFPSSGSGTITVTGGNNGTLNVPAGQYAKVLFYLDSGGALNVLQGTAATTLSAATVPPAPNGTLAIGYVVIDNSSGTVANIDASKIYQFATGAGGGSGTGNANEILETLKNRLTVSTWNFVTPNIFEVDESTLVDATSTGSYNLVTGTFDLDNTETFVSVQMLDDDFLADPRQVKSSEVAIFWDSAAFPTPLSNATYELSRDGGNNYQAISDISSIFSDANNLHVLTGTLNFTKETTSLINFYNVTTSDGTVELNTSSIQAVSQVFSLDASSVIYDINFNISKVGSPQGTLQILIVEDDGAGSPDLTKEKFAYTVDMSTVGSTFTGSVALENPLKGDATTPISYHLVIKANYTTYNAGADAVSLQTLSTASPVAKTYDGTTWSNAAYGLTATIDGIKLDLRLRITSSHATTVSLKGYGIFYDASDLSGQTVGDLKHVQRFYVDGSANQTSFTITNFLPDPDLLVVYDLYTGKSYTYPYFEISGNAVRFPSGTFSAPGQKFYVVFSQIKGGSFDNSDVNGSLLAENHLGSSSSVTDRSVPGRGIVLRRPDGTLRELTIDDTDNIVIKSYP